MKTDQIKPKFLPIMIEMRNSAQSTQMSLYSDREVKID